MNIVKRFSKYIIIVLIGILLAFFVAWIEYDAHDLSASVLSLTEQDFFESTKRDAWYKKENQIFEVFLAEQVRNEWILTVFARPCCWIISPTTKVGYINSSVPRTSTLSMHFPPSGRHRRGRHRSRRPFSLPETANIRSHFPRHMPAVPAA